MNSNVNFGLNLGLGLGLGLGVRVRVRVFASLVYFLFGLFPLWFVTYNWSRFVIIYFSLICKMSTSTPDPELPCCAPAVPPEVRAARNPNELRRRNRAATSEVRAATNEVRPNLTLIG